MKVLFFGDIVGKIGRKAIAQILPELKKEYSPDLVIANVENLAHGKGITEDTLKSMTEIGIDFFTSGNHIWKKKDAVRIFEAKNIPVIRPANYPAQVPGSGYKIIEVGSKKVLIINLVGRVFMREDFDCPFVKFDEILKETKLENPDIILIDFHAEATSEKRALGF
ncbi:YmdB family metallophosphoesterase, partial [Candidatus Falkowbacteria bacterium]|nr:YmdB family metallophosphoesterase [Candidatus Falkowbacteria bacterium]